MSGLATLVIGVGGTGLKVLQYVKERLLETYAGVVPAHIGLLALDTEAPAADGMEGGVSLAVEPSLTAGETNPRRAEVHLLPPSPVFTLHDVLREAQSGAERWAWLEADKLAPLLSSQKLPSDLPTSSRPSGRIRLQLNYRQVKTALEQALHNLAFPPGTTTVSMDTTLDYIRQHTRQNIFLVGSLAGSSGGGTLIDTAVLLRSITQVKTYSSYSFIGMIALPSCFAGHVDISGRRLSNSYAGLRELDRFMRGHTAATPCTITLPDGTRTELDNMLFDFCYLVDAQDHGGIARATRADTGALGAIADAIVTHIDLRCGLRLNATYTNVSAQYHRPSGEETSNEGYRYQPRRLYSALNTHAVIFPRQDVIRSLGLRFLREMLDSHLIQRAAYTSGLAVPTTPLGIKDLLNFLSKDNPTPQEKIQAELYTLAGDLDVGIFIRTLLRYSANSKSSYATASPEILAWLVEDGKKRGEIQIMLEQSLKEITRPVDEPRYLPGYSRRAQTWIAHYLPHSADAPEPLRCRGEWPQALCELPVEMRTALRIRVHTLVVRLLNQRQVEDQGTKRHNLLRANRLGYALEVLRTLKKRVQQFKRQTQSSFEKYIRSRDRLRQAWQKLHANFITLEPNVPWLRHNPGPDYLNQLYELAEVEWQCLLCQYILDVSEQLGGEPDADGEVSIIDSAIRELEAWATTLAAVRDQLVDAEKQHSAQRQAKQQIKTRSYITDPAQFPAAIRVEEQLYANCRDRLWRTFLGMGDSPGMGLEWLLCPDQHDAYTLQIGNPGPSHVVPIEIPKDAQTLISVWETYTLRLLTDLLHRDQQTRVAGHITVLVDSAQTFVQRWLQPHRRALIRLHTIQADPQQEEHYLAVDPTSEDRKVTDFYSWIQTNWQQSSQHYIQAESEVACTFLTLYHGLELTHVAGFVEGAAAYRNLLRRGESLHLFPEEQYAAAYEVHMPTLSTPEWQQVRCLHPQVVVCLHTPEHVRAFALALVSGLICSQRLEQSEEYLLQVPGHPAIQLSASATIVDYPQLSRRPLDRQAALLLQAFQTFMLRGHAIDNVNEGIAYTAIAPAYRHWLDTTRGQLDSTARIALVRAWETDQEASPLSALLYAESHDPRFHDLGIVLLLELYAWAESESAAEQ